MNEDMETICRKKTTYCGIENTLKVAPVITSASVTALKNDSGRGISHTYGSVTTSICDNAANMDLGKSRSARAAILLGYTLLRERVNLRLTHVVTFEIWYSALRCIYFALWNCNPFKPCSKYYYYDYYCSSSSTLRPRVRLHEVKLIFQFTSM